MYVQQYELPSKVSQEIANNMGTGADLCIISVRDCSLSLGIEIGAP